MISFINWPNVRVITIYWSYFSGMSVYLKFCPKKTEWPYSLTRVCDLKKPYSFLLDKLMLYAYFMFSELLLRSYVKRKATPYCKTTLLSWFNSNIRHWCIDEHLMIRKLPRLEFTDCRWMPIFSSTKTPRGVSVLLLNCRAIK